MAHAGPARGGLRLRRLALLLFSFAIGPNAAALRQHAGGFPLAGPAAVLDARRWPRAFRRDGAARARGPAAAAGRPARALLRQGARELGCSSRCSGIGARAGDGRALRRGDDPDPGAPRRHRAGRGRALGSGHALCRDDVAGAGSDRRSCRCCSSRSSCRCCCRPSRRRRCSSSAIRWARCGSWTLLLVSFDAIHWSLCGLLFGRVVED